MQDARAAPRRDGWLGGGGDEDHLESIISMQGP